MENSRRQMKLKELDCLNLMAIKGLFGMGYLHAPKPNHSFSIQMQVIIMGHAMDASSRRINNNNNNSWEMEYS